MNPEQARAMRNRFGQIRAAVEDWKRGNISAPEAIARVARVVGVPLSAEPEPHIVDPADPRLGLRAVLSRSPDEQGSEIIALECGHQIQRLIVRPAAARMRCPDCVNEIIDAIPERKNQHGNG